jgi:hypothetical protein
MIEEKLAKIERASFGMGGYQDAMIGISFTLSGQGWGTNDFWGYWALKRSEYCKWSEEDRLKDLGKTVLRIRELLKDSKKDSVEGLVGVPVMVKFEGNMLKEWRILTEVI